MKVNVDMVLVDVMVQGNPGRELRPGDFVVYDNDVAQEIVHFSRDRLPLKIAILVDTSGSILPFQQELADSVRSVLDSLNVDDQIALFSFSTASRKLIDFTRDGQAISLMIRKLVIGGGTNICGAIFDAVRFMYDNTPDYRRAVFLISDNYATMGSVPTDMVVGGAQAAGASIFGIEIANANFRKVVPTKECSVYNLANSTGGIVLNAHTPGSLSKALAQAVAHLRMQYTLGFLPSNVGPKGSYHKLTVKLKTGKECNDCPLLARRGYYSGIPAFFHPETAGTETMPVLATIESDAYNSITAAAGSDTDAQEISFKLKTEKLKDAAGKPQMGIELKINPAGIGFRTADDLHVCKLHVAIFYGDSFGTYLGHYWKTVELQLPDPNYRAIMKSAIPYSAVIPVLSKKQYVKIVIYDVGTARLGARTIQK